MNPELKDCEHLVRNLIKEGISIAQDIPQRSKKQMINDKGLRVLLASERWLEGRTRSQWSMGLIAEGGGARSRQPLSSSSIPRCCSHSPSPFPPPTTHLGAGLHQCLTSSDVPPVFCSSLMLGRDAVRFLRPISFSFSRPICPGDVSRAFLPPFRRCYCQGRFWRHWPLVKTMVSSATG